MKNFFLEFVDEHSEEGKVLLPIKAESGDAAYNFGESLAESFGPVCVGSYPDDMCQYKFTGNVKEMKSQEGNENES